ncbi:sugar isomerase [Roseivirga pacifica]|uniref:sugar isomerase n=1 Tax=Roseivirga pacifica TaxID=1267423 RepID=UPI003BAFE03B
MRIDKEQLKEHNQQGLAEHQRLFGFLAESLDKKGVDVNQVMHQLHQLQVAIPSWALGAGGTRFGRFAMGGEPGTLEQKIDDIGMLKALTQATSSVSLHIPWDIPSNAEAIKSQATELGIKFDAVNSNTFQDQQDQSHSYKFGSLADNDCMVREQAINHNLEVIKYGEILGSKSITVWLADGASFPGQNNFKRAFRNTESSLHKIYEGLPVDWKMLIEYKPYEPNFYSTVIQDWGTSLMLAESCGEQAYTLVDLGHHLPNTNIEQIVATLIMRGRLGGFHFNDSKYGDDDLTCGSIKPYQLFLICSEIIGGMQDNDSGNPALEWMIDASHNLKDPLEDLIQSLEAIRMAYAQALIVDREALYEAQMSKDVSHCQEILQDAYRTDVRPLLAEVRRLNGGALNPMDSYRKMDVREKLITERGKNVVATGL